MKRITKFIIAFILFFTFILTTEAKDCVIISGTGKNLGDEVACGTEHFYVVSNDGTNAKLLSKYNLYAGKILQRINLEPFNLIDYYNGIYTKEEIQKKAEEGWFEETSIYEYDDDLDEYTFTGTVVYKNIGQDNNTAFFCTSDCTIEDVLKNSSVKEKLNQGYSYEELFYIDKLLGVLLYEDNFKYVFFEEEVTNVKSALTNAESKKLLDKGYSYELIENSNDNFIGITFYEYDDDYYSEKKYVFLSNDVDSIEEAIKSKEVKELLDKGYLADSYISSENKYFAVILVKEEGYEDKTILFEQEDLTKKTLLAKNEIKQLLDQGYSINDYYDPPKSVIKCSINSYCVETYYGISLYKSEYYEYKTIYFDDYIDSTTYAEYKTTNPDILEAQEDGFTIYESLSDRYYNYTSGGTTEYRYFGVIMEKNIKEEPEYVFNEESVVEVRQDKTALGTHGGTIKNPEPIEIGVISSGDLWGNNYDENTLYSNGYLDYEISLESEAYYYLRSYYHTLKNDGYKIKNADLITISEINQLVYNLTGNYIPLEDWYDTWKNNGEEKNHYLTEHPYYTLGSIKDLLPEGYDWLWGSTYWTRTSDEYGSYNYFIDTLGDLCAVDICDYDIGAGIRPLITMASENIKYEITTKVNGKGTLTASHETADPDHEITFEVKPAEGYVLGEVKVIDEEGNAITFTDYKFTMPSANVIIEATFVPHNPDTSDIAITFIISGIIICTVIFLKSKYKLSWIN